MIIPHPDKQIILLNLEISIFSLLRRTLEELTLKLMKEMSHCMLATID